MNSQEATIYTAIIISSFVIGMIIIYFFISIIRHQYRNLELQRQNILSEITAMEKERSRIANDLHDELSPLLSVIRFQINSITLSVQDDEHQVNKASAHLDNLICRLREISNNLMPVSLLRKGLLVTIAEFLRNIEATGNIRINFDCHGIKEIPQEKSIHIYRIVQELIHNGVKHAQASELTLQMRIRNNCLSMTCVDNGIGFDYEKVTKESTGFGLRSLKSRCELIGGKMMVESKRGEGAAFLFQIPIQ